MLFAPDRVDEFGRRLHRVPMATILETDGLDRSLSASGLVMHNHTQWGSDGGEVWYAETGHQRLFDTITASLFPAQEVTVATSTHIGPATSDPQSGTGQRGEGETGVYAGGEFSPKRPGRPRGRPKGNGKGTERP